MITLNKFLLALVLLLVLMAPCAAEHKLKIIKPEALANKFTNSHIILHVSSIGVTPHHSTMTGMVTIGKPNDGC
jgi:beta-mannanase